MPNNGLFEQIIDKKPCQEARAMRAFAFVLLLGLAGCGVHTAQEISLFPSDECVFQSDIDLPDGRDNDCDGTVDEDGKESASADGGSTDAQPELPCRGPETCDDGIACTDDVCTPEGCRHLEYACNDPDITPPKPDGPKPPELRSCSGIATAGAIDALIVNSTFLRITIAGTISDGLIAKQNSIASVAIGSASNGWNTDEDHWSESWNGEGIGVLYTLIIPRAEFVPRVRANGKPVEFDLCKWRLTGVLKRQLATTGRTGEVLVAP